MELTDAQKMARKIFREWELHKKGWTFEIADRLERSYWVGDCNTWAKRIRLRRDLVELNDEYEVKQTILHEVAHALVPRGEPSHGRVWKHQARMCGVDNPSPRCSGATRTGELPRVERKATIRRDQWRFSCPCGKEASRKNYPARSRTTREYKKSFCKRCGREIDHTDWIWI